MNIIDKTEDVLYTSNVGDVMNFLILVLLTLLSGFVFAQEIVPRVAYIYPAGGKRGTTFELVAGGQYLRGVTNVYFSGSGISATIVEHIEPISQRQAQLLRDKLKELQQKRAEAMRTGKGWSAEDQKMVEEIRKRLANFIPPRDLNPALAEIVRIKVTISEEAEVGEREVRFLTPIGLSNPNVFYVGTLNEYTRQHRRIFRQGREDRDPVVSSGEGELRISLPAILNGQIMPGGVNKYRFSARKGQRIVIATLGRQLIPYIPDAVPGWFQAVVALYDSKGKELARADDFLFNPDPVLYYEIPADGEYVFEIRDAIYRGREDFIYRVVIGELPFITGIFPLGISGNKRGEFELKGWNLGTNKITLDFNGVQPGIYQIKFDENDLLKGKMAPSFWVKRPTYGVENPSVLLQISDLPEAEEIESNNSTNFAQSINLPVIINGKINTDEDIDSFRFYGRKGDVVVAEVLARRLNSPLDSVVYLVDDNGDVVAFNDDYEDKGSGLTTHHADSYLLARIPRDGVCYIRIASAQHRGGDGYIYRLRISHPQPDFEIRISPSELSVRQGGCNDFTIYALRKDGFDGEIQIGLKDSPMGFRIDGGRIPAGKEKIRATLSAPQGRLSDPIKIKFQASALINGKTVVKDVVPAKEMMQAFAYHHLTPVSDFYAYCRSMNPQRVPVRLVSETPIKLKAGFATKVSFEGPPLLKEFSNLSLSEPPDGILLKNVVATRYGFDLVLYADAEKIKTGFEDNLIVEISPRPLAQGNKSAMQGVNRRRIAIGTLPAIPVRVVR